MRLAIATIMVALAVGRSWSDEKTPAKAPLPFEAKVKWDLDTFEKSPAFNVVKRDVKGNQVVWILENRRMLGTEITFGYQAAFYDEDGVKLFVIEFETHPWMLNMPQGERNRFVLNLPKDEKWKQVRKVVIKNGEYN
jgi:hypothetical protein